MWRLLLVSWALRCGVASLVGTGGVGGCGVRPQESACRGVAQLAEHRSPKPGVASSSPAAPARPPRIADRSVGSGLGRECRLVVGTGFAEVIEYG